MATKDLASSFAKRFRSLYHKGNLLLTPAPAVSPCLRSAKPTAFQARNMLFCTALVPRGHFVFWLLAIFAVLNPWQLANAGELAIWPPEIRLAPGEKEHGVVVTWKDDSGIVRDVTSQATLHGTNPSQVDLSRAGRVVVKEAVTTEIFAEYQGARAKLSLTAAAASEPPVSFQQDVLPVLTRYGCNQGGCHGKQAGQNGFRLSLRGYAPEQDHAWITREFEGRRVSLTRPSDSLLLKKPAGQMFHGGGKLFAGDSRAAQVLERWIAEGVASPVREEPTPTKIEVFPPHKQATPGDRQSLVVVAYYADGTMRDVTWLAQFFSNDRSVLEVSPDGVVQSRRPGESVVRVHFLSFVNVVEFTIPFANTPAAEEFAKRNNAIDDHVMAKLSQLAIPPSPLCDDVTFLRRAMLTALGTLPTAEEVRAFESDTSPDKRAKLIESILQRPEFTDYWALQLADLLQNRKERDHDARGVKGVRKLHQWIRQQVAVDRPWNEMVHEILTSQGNVDEHPTVGYYIVSVGEFRKAEESDIVSAAAQGFLGTRIGCAKCHNHPLERYTQDDYYHFAAYFSRISFQREDWWKSPAQLVIASEDEQNVKRDIDNRQKEIAKLVEQRAGKADKELEDLNRQIEEKQKQLEGVTKSLEEVRKRPITARQPRTGQAMIPQPLDRTSPPLSGGDPRMDLATWLTSPTNEQFSGSFVNRVWKHFLGTGLVEPVDDLRASNPPSNRPLWNALNREFVEHRYSLRHLVRVIMNSRTFQLSSETRPENATEIRFYSHFYARRLPSEVLLDAVSYSTGIPDEFAGYPIGIRAIQVPDPAVKSYFLTLFGRSERTTACACERSGEVTLPQLLFFQSGDDLMNKLSQDQGRLKQLLKQNMDANTLLDEVFLACLSRKPSDTEKQAIAAELTKTDNKEEALRDLFWALLNTKEFAFNH